MKCFYIKNNLENKIYSGNHTLSNSNSNATLHLKNKHNRVKAVVQISTA